MQASHTATAVSVRFDDPNLVSCAGLVPLLRLASEVGLHELADEQVVLDSPVGANAGAKVTSIVAGMAAGADSIDDLDLLRHGALPTLFDGIRAPSTLGSFLRGFTPTDATMLEGVAQHTLIALAGRTDVLAGIDQLAFVDIDSKICEVYGPGKQGAAYGYTGVLGLNVQAVSLSSPLVAPTVLATRLREGNADTRREATSLLIEALGTARAAGATGVVLVRGDSGFYVGELIRAVIDTGARFSVTAPQRRPIRETIHQIPKTRWRPVSYARPVYDEPSGTWIRHAEIAETTYTAFTNPTEHPAGPVTARLLVRRTPVTSRDEQGELFTTWRYHAVFTNSRFDLPTAWAQHDGRCGAIEQVFADLADSALAHLPSGKLAANTAWLTLAALAHNLTRAAGTLASVRHARARTSTLRRQLITIPARLARSARRLTLHLPRDWPWQPAFTGLFTTTHAPP